MPVTLYGGAFSPPCRAVFMVAEAIGLTLEIKNIDLSKGDHRTPEYLKINPLHSIPSIDDDGTILVDSHAIITYLVSKYGKDDSLYPKDLVKRALVDEKLHFDTGIAFNLVKSLFRAHAYDHQKELFTPKQIEDLEEVYGFLNTFLEGHKWLVGDSMTLADISLLATTTSLEVMYPIDNKKYPNVRRWLKDAETLSILKVNKPGLEDYSKSWKWAIEQ